jgi:hypothetical protein
MYSYDGLGNSPKTCKPNESLANDIQAKRYMKTDENELILIQKRVRRLYGGEGREIKAYESTRHSSMLPCCSEALPRCLMLVLIKLFSLLCSSALSMISHDRED